MFFYGRWTEDSLLLVFIYIPLWALSFVSYRGEYYLNKELRHNHLAVNQVHFTDHTHTHVKHSTRTREMRCCSLKMVEKNESESAQLVCLYSQFPNWLIHFQELESMLGTKFLPKGCWILQVSAALKYNVAFKWGSMTWIPFNATFHGMIGVFTQFKMMQPFFSSIAKLPLSNETTWKQKNSWNHFRMGKE